MSQFKRIHVDSEKLIQVVKARPMIYDKDNPHYYHSKKKKTQCWADICREVVPNYDKLSPQARVECCHEIQRRWKSLRTCFGREVAVQKKEEIRRQKGLSLKRRKVYGFFKEMSFLLPHFNGRPKADDDGVDGMEYEASEDSDDPLDSSIKAEVNDFERGSKNDDIVIESFPMYENTDGKSEFSYQHESNKEEEDDVKQFLMSLVPTFKKFDDRQKFEAKIEILKVLKNISFTKEGTSSS